MMEEITLKLGERSYTVYIDYSHLERLPELMRNVISFERVLVVTNTTVGELYAEQLLDVLNTGGYTPELLILPDGERYKDITSLRKIYDFLIENNFPRQSTIIALGGGVIGDIAGFAAATYMRGINFIQVPTTLLAMVDASVGGKVAINHPLGKNLIGAFYQPRLVFINLEFLKTLPEEELRCGYAEVIKYGIIRDADFFEYLEDRTHDVLALDKKALQKVVATSCRIKADIVQQDEREADIRAILNYGHTVGHAIESLTRYCVYKHGEAVAIGMVAAARIGARLEMIDNAEVERIWQIIRMAGLPYRFKHAEPEDIVERITKDKKVLGHKVRYVLPRRIGVVEIVSDVSPALVIEVLKEMKE
ncbi:3-dehydroquinate synthase [Candidatus Sumerlaeota bacterium]|nr:3-dehydroquinate synthase [Candidatus Sumerlaeota bacterium]